MGYRTARWIMIERGSIYRQISSPDIMAAREIAEAVFPELEGDFVIVPWDRASREQQNLARQSAPLTRRMCERAGLIEAEERSIDRVRRLARGFLQAAAQGGGN